MDLMGTSWKCIWPVKNVELAIWIGFLWKT